ncbi:MAG: glycosyltransferase family 4 protein [Acidimicrobiales bacterium]|jgi:phosphatidylinositol alpha-1,6-mannosyltransferase
MGYMLVTNDFPPKLGGIQSYLYELFRRLPPEELTVLTTAYRGASAFDRRQQFRIERSRLSVLIPTPGLVRNVRQLVQATGGGLVLFDPALPLGLLGGRLQVPFGVVLHGAEVTVPARLPVSRQLLRSVLSGASLAIAAGSYPAAEAARVAGSRKPRFVVVPPGVDHERFQPLGAEERAAERRRLGLPAEGRLVVSVSRLVPRKGMDVLIEAVGRLSRGRPDLTLAIGGSGRDRRRLELLARRCGVPVRFLGRVTDDDLPRLDAAADVWAMCCRDRWFGLEQEGFGIVFLEAAAAGVAQLAGRSGGSYEAVVDGQTGLVVDRPGDATAVAAALASLLDDPELRERLGAEARRRAVTEFDYDKLARMLHSNLVEMGG